MAVSHHQEICLWLTVHFPFAASCILIRSTYNLAALSACHLEMNISMLQKTVDLGEKNQTDLRKWIDIHRMSLKPRELQWKIPFVSSQ